MRPESHILDLTLILLLLGGGGFMLYQALTPSVSSQIEVLGGSLLSAIGLLLLYLEAAFFIRWSREPRARDDHRAH